MIMSSRRSSPTRRSGCPISIALELLGDSWSLLIVRDLMFKGLTTFGEFQQAGEGIATNILSDRLARLERAGIVTRRPRPDDGRRVTYRLTAKGLDLAPTLIELVLWSARYERTDAPPATLRAMRHRRAQVLADLRARWKSEAQPRRADLLQA
jgi:DNA-binding HxlR family transcriptional regulator